MRQPQYQLFDSIGIHTLTTSYIHQLNSSKQLFLIILMNGYMKNNGDEIDKQNSIHEYSFTI